MRVLIAVDDSAQSEAVLELGAQFLRASQFGETPTILTVISDKQDRPRAQRTLAYGRDLLDDVAEHLRAKIRTGHVASEIIKETQEERYDLLVVGLKPETSLLAWWRGSTTTQLIEQVDCSVALAKGSIRPLRRILLCDSGGKSPSLVNHFISSLGSLLSQEISITVLHVMSQISAGPHAKTADLVAGADELIRAGTPEGQWLAQDLKLLENAQVRGIPKVRHGLVVDEILSEAINGDYDLVAIGAHQREGWTGFLFDNLAR
ncbi:MAG TPA: universal stress protein, partial [Caldilineaceae bacterium]|nr:universal stress protein [Caldilineaceae bacterium]